MRGLGLGLGLFSRLKNLIMGIRPDTGEQYSSHIYDAGDYTGRVLLRTFDNDQAAPNYPKNTVAWLGVNVDNNTNPVSPAVPAIAIAVESSYYDPGTMREQQELHLNCFINGVKKRPLSMWHNLGATRNSNFTLRGTIGINDDADSPYIRFSASSRRLQLYPSRGPGDPAVQLATTDGSRVQARGFEVIAGTLQITAYTVIGLPSASPANQVVIVTDEVGGRTLATSDGSKWHRVSDGAEVSA